MLMVPFGNLVGLLKLFYSIRILYLSNYNNYILSKYKKIKELLKLLKF